MSRWAELTRLGFDSYADYLTSDHWQDVRRRYRASGRPMVCICGVPSQALHHQTYERIGCEELDDLVPLCNACHATVHDLERRGLSGLAVSALCDASQAAIYERETQALRERRQVPTVSIQFEQEFLKRFPHRRNAPIRPGSLADRVYRVIEFADDPRVACDLTVIERQLDRFEKRALSIFRRSASNMPLKALGAPR